MGIYIKGVKLPKLSDYSKRTNTPEVYNLYGAIVVYPDGKAELKSYFGTFEGIYDVISVPPRGGLVELSKVLDIVCEWCPDDDGSVGKDGDLREMLDEIEALPTVDS